MRLSIPLLILLALTSSGLHAEAEDFSSTNFTLNDPIIAEPASYGTSSNFGLWGVIPNIAPTSGTSTSFGVNPGFLAYSDITMPTLSATADTTSLDLSWSAAEGSTAVTYEPGYATTLGGPYTFSATQTARTATINGLSASTAYYLIVRVKEQSGGALLGYSNELAITTLASGGDSDSAGSIPIAPIGWVYGPDGLVPADTMTASSTGSPMFVPGESFTVAPFLVRQFGYIVSLRGDLEVPIQGAEVRLLRLNAATNIFEPWPTEEASLVFTDALGLYSFIVPPGTYQLRVLADGYLSYTGATVVVDATGELDQRIVLTEKLGVDVPWYLLVGLSLIGAAFAVMALFFMLRFMFRR